jgi:hypothetical protein
MTVTVSVAEYAYFFVTAIGPVAGDRLKFVVISTVLAGKHYNTEFYILLTVHLGVILVNNQLEALFSMYLFHFSTRFEQPSAQHQENQLYQYIIYQSDIYQMMY